jgi:hypothetical protein
VSSGDQQRSGDQQQPGGRQQPGSQQQPVNAILDVSSTSKVAAAVEVPEVSKRPSLQDASTIPLATVVQVSTLPSPIHPVVPVPSLLESEKITQPAASIILGPSTPAKFHFSFTGVPGLGTSAQIPQNNQPLFLPSPVSSPGVDANDDISTSPNLASRICDLRKFSSSAERKNYAFVLAPRRPPYLVKYLQLEKQKIEKRITSLSKSVAREEGM